MRYEHAYYRTKDKSLDIEFLMLDLGKPLGWRAYVMSDIDYKRVSAQRSDDYRDTHLYLDNGTHRYIDKTKDWPYVCRVDPIYDLDVMRHVAGAWCEITAYYIKHGGSFKDIQVKLLEEGVL